MKRTNPFRSQSSLDSFFVTTKREKSVGKPTTSPTATIEIITGTTELATTSAATSASISIATQHVEHEKTDPRDRQTATARIGMTAQ